jgi:hypothetical protein
MLLAVGAVQIVGCADALVLPSAPDEGSITHRIPPDLAAASDCTLSVALCAKLDTAITTLQNNPSSYCADLGDDARARLDAVGFGYRRGDEGPTPQTMAYVPMYDVGGGQYVPADDNVYVNEWNLQAYGLNNDIAYLTNELVGHEERHHRGWAPHHYPGWPPIGCDP